MVAAIASLLLAGVGVWLLIKGSLAASALSEGMAVASGAGSAGLRWMASELRQQRNEMAAAEEDQARTLRAVGVVLMMPEGERRDTALAELASRIAPGVATTDSPPTSTPST